MHHEAQVTLNENHRRVVSAVLRRVEFTCDEVLFWLARPSGMLHSIRDDTTPQQAEQLRGLTDRLREEVARFQREVTLNASLQSRARAISGVLSVMRTELEEVLTPGLRGYGPLDPSVEIALDAKFSRLLACLEAMSWVLARRDFRGAP